MNYIYVYLSTSVIQSFGYILTNKRSFQQLTKKQDIHKHVSVICIFFLYIRQTLNFTCTTVKRKFIYQFIVKSLC